MKTSCKRWKKLILIKISAMKISYSVFVLPGGYQKKLVWGLPSKNVGVTCMRTSKNTLNILWVWINSLSPSSKRCCPVFPYFYFLRMILFFINFHQIGIFWKKTATKKQCQIHCTKGSEEVKGKKPGSFLTGSYCVSTQKCRENRWEYSMDCW